MTDRFGSNLDPEKILQGLNEQQAAAVKAKNGPVLIVAGAGSGKTKVLTHRIAYLVASGVSPRNILALTFTNKAANEMKQRIASLVGSRDAALIRAGTFHSIFARLLRQSADFINYTSDFTIYDSEDSLSTIKKIFKEKSLPEKPLSPQQVASIISKAKNRLQTWQSIYDSARNPQEKIFAEIYKLYEERLRDSNAMDFDDLLWNFIRLLEEHPDVLEFYQDTFRYIMVDEYQDTNHAQYVAIRLLSKKYQNICVVGDDAQSIYGWRGADIQNILEFKRDYPHAKIFKLEQNYRSTKTILEAAHSVIQNNTYQIKKKLFTENESGDLIDLVECSSDREEAEFVVSRISKLSESGVPLNEICILYRTNAQSLEFEKSCRKYSIPYIVVGGTSFYKRKEVKDVLAYLRTLINPRDREAILRIINEPARGIGETSLKHINSFAIENGLSFFEALKNVDNIEGLVPKSKNAIKHFVEFIENYRQKLTSEDYSTVVAEFIKKTGLIEFYQEIGTDEAYDRIENIEQVVSDITYFAEENPDSTLNDYIQQMSLVADIDTSDLSKERLPIMTLHSAKGLEFRYVFIAGMEDGIFPISRASFNKDEEEEERRLFYVGITRAKEKLTLTCARSRMKFGDIMMQKPSYFLKEIEPSLIQQLDSSGTPISSTASKFSSHSFKSNHYEQQHDNDYSYSQIEKTVYDFRIGDLVRHNQFGVGKITGLSGEGSMRKATVNFANIGKKLLLLQYAKLEIIKQAEQ